MIPFTKAHAYGNDFLYVDAAAIDAADRRPRPAGCAIAIAASAPTG